MHQLHPFNGVCVCVVVSHNNYKLTWTSLSATRVGFPSKLRFESRIDPIEEQKTEMSKMEDEHQREDEDEGEDKHDDQEADDIDDDDDDDDVEEKGEGEENKENSASDDDDDDDDDGDDDSRSVKFRERCKLGAEVTHVGNPYVVKNRRSIVMMFPQFV